jgi:hypothetical protein
VQGTTALVVGAHKSAGTDPFDGKIAQASVHSACLSDAQIKAMASQIISSSTPSIVSGFTFNGAATDVSANANDLTASGGATYGTDSPFNATEYGIITANSFSTNTTLTVQVPEGYAIPTTGGVSSMYYSTQDVPYGFPVEEDISITKIKPGNSRSLYATNSSTVTKAGSSTSYTQVSSSLYLTSGTWFLYGSIDVTWPASYDAEFIVRIYDQTNAQYLSISTAAAVRNAVANAVGYNRNTCTIITVTTPRVIHLGFSSGGGSATTFSCLADGSKLIAIRMD